MRCNRTCYMGLFILENILMTYAIKESNSGDIREANPSSRDHDVICKNNDKDCKYKDKCIDPAGWNLRGSDWGCCGNYDGCCTYASLLCYIHDALCRCCDLGDKNFCGPRCKPEVDCLAPSTPRCSPETDCMTTATTYPCQPEVDCSTTSGDYVDNVDKIHNKLVENVIEQQASDMKNKQKPTNLENYKNAEERYYKKIHSMPLVSKTKYNSENGYQSDFVPEGSGDLEGQ